MILEIKHEQYFAGNLPSLDHNDPNERRTTIVRAISCGFFKAVVIKKTLLYPFTMLFKVVFKLLQRTAVDKIVVCGIFH